MSNTHGPLNVVALISGGKDSMFSLLHCLANSHRVVALANLFPKDEEEGDSISNRDAAPEDIALDCGRTSWDKDVDSFMYQTAGHNLIPLYAKVLGLPLYRQRITGDARDTSKTYQSAFSINSAERDADETEALVPLLRTVIAAHRQVNAVCSGAILSTYQRTRIESVAIRLGLIPLSYLWQYPSLPPPSPGGLLDDMAAVGFDVRLIKVASGGLDERLLWSNLMDPLVRKRVEKAVRRFGGSLLGEGGEFETMVISGPHGVWQGKIEIAEEDIRTTIEQGSSACAFVAFREGSGKVLSMETGGEQSKGPTDVRNPGLWDKAFKALLENLQPSSGIRNGRMQRTHSADSEQASTIDEDDSMEVSLEWKPHTCRSANFFVISNLTALSEGNTAGEQMSGIGHQLLHLLKEVGRPISSIVFTTIILRSMSEFAAVNAVYGRLFTKPNPPARVTIACTLPFGIQAALSVVVNMTDSVDALHVQSRSYWAPANIGPYSQATKMPFSIGVEPSWVFVAGQIPLIPATMELLVADNDPEMAVYSDLTAGFRDRACLSLQHLWRIGKEMEVGWWTGAVAFIVGPGDVQAKANAAWTVWKDAHNPELWEEPEEADNGLDAWDKRYGGLGSLSIDNKEEHSLPDFTRMAHEDVSDFVSPSVPGFLAVQVDELPRGCDIEWQSLGIANSEVKLMTESVSGMRVRSCMIPSFRRLVSYVEIHLPLDSEQGLTRRRLLTAVQWARNVSAQDEDMHVTIYTSEMSLAMDMGAQVVPCRALWGPEGTSLIAGIVVNFKMKHGSSKS